MHKYVAAIFSLKGLGNQFVQSQGGKGSATAAPAKRPPPRRQTLPPRKRDTSRPGGQRGSNRCKGGCGGRVREADPAPKEDHSRPGM